MNKVPVNTSQLHQSEDLSLVSFLKIFLCSEVKVKLNEESRNLGQVREAGNGNSYL